jgi:small subunit ribosomal protein S11
MAQPKSKTAPIKKPTRIVERGRMYITATFNNTIATVSDENGSVINWSSAGASGFSGSRKSTPYAATVTIEKAITQAKTFGLKTIDVFIKGPGPGRDAALRVLRGCGLKINLIADVTPIPHNGTRPRKKKHNR